MNAPKTIPFTRDLWQTGEWEVGYADGTKIKDVGESHGSIWSRYKSASYVVLHHLEDGKECTGRNSGKDLLLIPRTPQPESKEDRPEHQYTRTHFHKMLDQAMDETQEGDFWLPQMVRLVMKEMETYK